MESATLSAPPYLGTSISESSDLGTATSLHRRVWGSYWNRKGCCPSVVSLSVHRWIHGSSRPHVLSPLLASPLVLGCGWVRWALSRRLGIWVCAEELAWE